MAKPIKLTEHDIEEAVQEYLAGAEKFRKDLEKANMDNGEIKYTYSKKLGAFEKEANVIISGNAWRKMKALIDSFSSEVAWHCISHRGENDGEFIVEDVIVYPQKVTGTTVKTDMEEYQRWYMSQPDDIYQDIRTQCHSHVNMGVSPSSTDLDDQRKTLEILGGDDYYIFMIWNKRYESYCVVFDINNNVKYENADCTVEVVDEDGLLEFIEEAQKVVVKETWSSSKKSATNKNAMTTTSDKGEKKVVNANSYTKGYKHDYYDDYYGGYGTGYGYGY